MNINYNVDPYYIPVANAICEYFYGKNATQTNWDRILSLLQRYDMNKISLHIPVKTYQALFLQNKDMIRTILLDNFGTYDNITDILHRGYQFYISIIAINNIDVNDVRSIFEHPVDIIPPAFAIDCCLIVFNCLVNASSYYDLDDDYRWDDDAYYEMEMV